jgi:hypothetical protein
MIRVLARILAAGMLLGACSSAATPEVTNEPRMTPLSRPALTLTPEPSPTPAPQPTARPPSAAPQEVPIPPFEPLLKGKHEVTGGNSTGGGWAATGIDAKAWGRWSSTLAGSDLCITVKLTHEGRRVEADPDLAPTILQNRFDGVYGSIGTEWDLRLGRIVGGNVSPFKISTDQEGCDATISAVFALEMQTARYPGCEERSLQWSGFEVEGRVDLKAPGQPVLSTWVVFNQLPAAFSDCGSPTTGEPPPVSLGWSWGALELGLENLGFFPVCTWETDPHYSMEPGGKCETYGIKAEFAPTAYLRPPRGDYDPVGLLP